MPFKISDTEAYENLKKSTSTANNKLIMIIFLNFTYLYKDPLFHFIDSNLTYLYKEHPKKWLWRRELEIILRNQFTMPWVIFKIIKYYALPNLAKNWK